MKLRSFFKCTAVASALLCASALTGYAQAQGGGGGGAGRGGMGVLTQEQRTKMRDAIQSEITPLMQQLVAAEKEAVKAALSDASEDSLKSKIEAVNKLQGQIAVVRVKGFKAIASTLTSEQKEQLEGMRDGGYMALFGATGGMAGGGGGRGNRNAGGGGGGNRNN